MKEDETDLSELKKLTGKLQDTAISTATVLTQNVDALEDALIQGFVESLKVSELIALDVKSFKVRCALGQELRKKYPEQSKVIDEWVIKGKEK